MKTVRPDLKIETSKSVTPPPSSRNCISENVPDQVGQAIQPTSSTARAPKKKRNLAITAAAIVLAAAVAVSGVLSLSSNQRADNVYVSDDYAVEHVADRIASKLPEDTPISSISDTGYRVRTRTLVVDAAQVGETDTIEDVYSGTDDEKAQRILYQQESLSTVYDLHDGGDYIVYLDVSGDDGKTEHPQDAVFAYDTTQGEMIDNIRYDKETGIAYIPRSLFDEERVKNKDDNQQELQAQTLVRYNLSNVADAYEQDKNADAYGMEEAAGESSSNNTIPTEIVSTTSTTKKMAQVPLVGNQFAIKAVDVPESENVEAADITVTINDGAVELDGYLDEYVEGTNMPSMSYDPSTGDVNIYNVSPSSVMNVIIGIDKPTSTSRAARAALATAGEIIDPTESAYTIGHYGQANATGYEWGVNGAQTKTIRRFGPGQSVMNFLDITKNDMSDQTCGYQISIGSCPRALGSYWTADGGTKWQANCVHAKYPSGSNPPSGGYYKILDADWNNQTITVAFFITCDSGGQESGIVLAFKAPRNGVFEIHKKANANPSLGSAWQSNVPAAVFGVYNSKAAAQTGGSAGLVKKLTTNSSGIANGSFEEGTYWVRELSAPWPYIVSNQIVSFSAKPKSKDSATIYDDTVPPIQIAKKIVPSKNSYVEGSVTSGGNTLLNVKTTMASDGKNITTEIKAMADVSNVIVKNSSTSVLGNPTSTDTRFNSSTGVLSNIKEGETVKFSQTVKSGAGWRNSEKLATACSVSASNARADMALPLHSISLSGTRYGVYSDAACKNKLGEAILDSNGVGYYGKKRNEWLSANTTYYVREVAGVNGYTVSSDIYPVTTSHNSQVSVTVADSFSTLILTKESGAGKVLTDKLPQFTLKGAKYGIFTDYSAAEVHDASRVCKTKDGRDAIITTNQFGKASEVALGEGTYYVAELPSSITRPWVWGQNVDGITEPTDIDASINSHDYNSKSNGQFLLDENVYTVTLKSGTTTFQVSKENIPVKIQLVKQSTRSDLSKLSQFSLEGAVFGVYETEAAAQAARTGNYQDVGFTIDPEGAVALLYGNKNGTTTVSQELPLRDYYVKELRAPKNYKLLGSSYWSSGRKNTSDNILHITADDFLSSGKYIDGILANTATVKVNEPKDVTVQVQKEASEVPDGLKVPGNAMSLAGARFAVYKSFDDAKADVNRLMFKTDNQAANDNTKTDFLMSGDDGWTNKAIGLPAEECYWVREIEPPHVISDNPEENAKNIAESMYVLDTEPVRATFEEPTSVAMTAHKDDAVKPVSITIGKYAYSIDNQGRNLHVGEKDTNGVPYNDAYTDSAFEGALFGLFETREQAEAATVTDDVNDVSVEQAAYDAGAIKVMQSDANGVCGTVDNLKWKADGYYVRELKAPTSGCYKRNESILQVGCDGNTEESAHIRLEVDNVIHRTFEVDEMPNYYYVKIEKTSSNPNVLKDTANYRLDGIHFGIYKTREEAEAATEANPGAPLYNLYTKKTIHSDGSIHYEAVTGLTGPGVFWAKELVKEGEYPRGFQVLDSPVRVEAKLGGIPVYDKTPIIPENSAPVVDKTTGQLGYKTAKDIDKANGTPVAKTTANMGRAALVLDVPTGGVMNARYTGLTNNTIIWGNTEQATSKAAYAWTGTGNAPIYSVTYQSVAHVARTDYHRWVRYYTDGQEDVYTAMGTLGSTTYSTSGWMYWVNGDYGAIQIFETENPISGGCYQDVIAFLPVTDPGYHITGWTVNGTSVSPGGARFPGGSVVRPIISPYTYAVSFNGNASGATNVSGAVTATYDAVMPTVTVPARTGYIFDGYYDAASGGTKYYNSNGTSARTWNKTSGATLYAHWTPIKYKVKYVATDPNAQLLPGMTTDGNVGPFELTYDQKWSLAGTLFHKFGYKQTGWKIKGGAALPAFTNQVRNLSTTNNATVEIEAVWSNNEYYVKYNDGLASQWGPAPVIEKGTNPDTGTAWSTGYQQKLWYDDWSKDGISSENLTRVRYSHPYFAFRYWVDANGVKYDDQQAVRNLAEPNKVKELTGVWYPAFDYGVDCEANIIVNQPIGGITIQKVVKSDNQAPTALTDLSGIVFDLYSDAACTQKVTSSTTDAKGIATFTGVKTSTNYYVKEAFVPERLANIMQISDEVKTVQAGSARSYSFENAYKQLTLSITKKPSQDAIDEALSEILDRMPPTGAKFAVYASEDDARNDENRLYFYDENEHLATVATLVRTVDVDGVKCAEVTLTGLPNQDLWICELVAPDYGNHEYIRNPEPIFISKDTSEAGNGSNGLIFSNVANSVYITPGAPASKTISDADLAKIPPMMREEALELCDGIQYALYMDRDDAVARNDEHVDIFTIENGKYTLSNLPYGTYYAIEWALPDEAIKAGISKSDKVIEITVNAEEPSPEIDMLDSIITKKMYVKKVDTDTQEPISGVVFDIYNDETKSELLCSTSASDIDGISISTDELIPGRSYFVQERYDSLPAEYNGQGVGNDNTWSGWVSVELDDTINDAFVVENKKNDEKGSIEVRKASNQSSASVAGAVFSIYDATGALYDTMTTGDDGVARIDDVPVGAYTVQETTPLDLHSLTSDGSDAERFEGIVYPDQCWNANDGEAVVNYQGYVKVHKESAAPETTDALPDVYSLAGAVYSFYPIIDGVESSTPLSATMVTDESGNCEPVAVPIGSYKVVETTEPDNFSTPMEMKEFYIDVTLDNAEHDTAVVVDSKDSPTAEPLANFIVEKRSAETYDVADGAAQGATNMGKTKFVIEYSPELASDYDDAMALDKMRKWYIETDADGRATFAEDSVLKDESDELFYDADGNAALPVGTIVVKEVVPPTGYTIGKASTAAYRFNGASAKFEELFADTDDVKEWDGNPTFTAANDIYRADISFDKVDAYDKNKVMAHIPFLLTLLDENGEAIERHLIATDENGHFSSKIGESTLATVNQNDVWIPGNVESGVVSAGFEPHDSRVWFSGTKAEVIPSADKGALIYGDYEIREYARPDTEHYQELTPIYFSVRGDNDQSWIEVDGKKIENGNLTDAIGKIQNHSIHIENTEFTDKVTGRHIMQEESLAATEVISYADATIGEKYIFETYAFDADTKEPITKWITDVDGETVEVQAGGTYTLECESETGEVSIDVSFEGYDVAGRKIGLMTKVYYNGVMSDEHNADLIDDAEAVSFSEIGTTATDSDTGQHIGFADGHIDITDIVKYTNLVPGYEYVADGVLMDKNTGVELRDAHGNVITGQTTFTAEARDGEVEVKFSFDAPNNTAFTAVAFETLSFEGKVVARHENIDDEEQTVIYPSVATTARDGVTNTAQGNAEGDKITVIDKIEYSNLIAGQKYEARGFLYTLDEQDNKTKIEGSDAKVTFAANESNGFVEMVFEAPADVVRGHRILVGEEIWSDGKIIARHDDAKFENQMVSYPSVGTIAADFLSGVHVGNGGSARKLVDTVHLEGLKAGETYRIDGTAMARDRQGNVIETQVKTTEIFTAVNSIEDYKLTFELPADFPAENAVVFEKLYSGNEGEESNLLATHEDGNDENQTVHYPKIGTVALYPDGGTHVGSNLDNRVVDTVRYENLVVGYDYVVVGMLVDKETGELIARENMNENGEVVRTPIISSTDFTPENMDGEVTVSFDVNGVDVAGKTLVVFEQLFVENAAGGEDGTPDVDTASGKTLVATHCDIDDDKQSMFYPHIKTMARDKATGTHIGSSLVNGTIIDVVEYTNLVPGYEYEISGVLMDKESGEELTVDVEAVKASIKFVPTEANGTVEVEFPSIIPENLIDKTIVAFETLSLGGFEMAEHKDIEDADQSVSYLRIATNAHDAKTGLHEGLVTPGKNGDAADGAKVQVVDVVDYSNLVAGHEYTMKGVMVDKESGEEVVSGETVFTAEEATGQVEVVFDIDAGDVYGRILVAFETLIDEDGNIVAEHKDIDDEAQTVSYPKIGTVAHDKLTNTHVGSIEHGITIVDTIAYEGLIEGHEYVVHGTLMDKNTGMAVVDAAGNEVVASAAFTAGEGGRGSVDVEFSAQLDESFELAGCTFVAFEQLVKAGSNNNGNDSSDNDDAGDSGSEGVNDIVIAVHEDINDEDQSIHYPRIRTIAKSGDDSKLIPFDRDAKIIDTVIYENLVPGVEYVLDGEMINKSRGDALMASGQAVIGQTTFVPETSDGEVEVVFELDGTNTETCQAVAFETLSVGGAVVAEHADIDDEDQTVNVAGVADELVISGTGDMIWMVIGSALIAIAIGGGVLGYRKWRRKK